MFLYYKLLLLLSEYNHFILTYFILKMIADISPHPKKIVLCIQSFKHAIEPAGTKILYKCYIVFKVVHFVGSNLFNRSSEYQYLGKVCIMQDVCYMFRNVNSFSVRALSYVGK